MNTLVYLIIFYLGILTTVIVAEDKKADASGELNVVLFVPDHPVPITFVRFETTPMNEDDAKVASLKLTMASEFTAKAENKCLKLDLKNAFHMDFPWKGKNLMNDFQSANFGKGSLLLDDPKETAGWEEQPGTVQIWTAQNPALQKKRSEYYACVGFKNVLPMAAAIAIKDHGQPALYLAEKVHRDPKRDKVLLLSGRVLSIDFEHAWVTGNAEILLPDKGIFAGMNSKAELQMMKIESAKDLTEHFQPINNK